VLVIAGVGYWLFSDTVRFYAEKGDAKKLKQLLPPLGPQAADRYRAIYEQSQKP
jgi:hypothetical protein